MKQPRIHDRDAASGKGHGHSCDLPSCQSRKGIILRASGVGSWEHNRWSHVETDILQRDEDSEEQRLLFRLSCTRVLLKAVLRRCRLNLLPVRPATACFFELRFVHISN